MRPKIVTDTNVIVSAVHFGGPPEEILLLANNGGIELFLSPFILDETARVLEKKLQWERGRIRRLIEALEEVSTIIEPRPEASVVRDDEADNRILDCAVEAKADFLVTGDKRHLLPLKRHKGIRIVTPRECLDALFGG